MRLKRTLAFVLTLAMLLGNVTPAFAAENSVSGNVVLTTDEDGNLQIKELSDEGSDGHMPDGNGSSDLNGGSGGDDTASDNDSGVSGNEPSVSDNDEPLIEVYHEGMSERLLFSSFGEAKEYIINDATENTNTRKEYELYLLGDVTIEDEEKDVLYYADEITDARIYLGLCGYTLEVKTDQNIRVNELDAGRYQEVGEEWELSKQGIVDVADGKTLSFYPRKLQDVTRGWIANVNLKAEKATVVVGNSETEEGEFIDLHNVTANVNNMELYDGIHWEGAGEANVGNLLKVKNDRNTYEAHIRSRLMTKDLEIIKGSNVHVADFEVKEDTTVTTESSFRIEANGNAVLGNIQVIEAEGEDFRFDLEQTVKLHSVDGNGKAYADYKNAEWNALFSSEQFSPEEVFDGVEVLDSKGMLTVTGAVTGAPIRLQKIYCWNLPPEENWQQAAGVNFDIENGEDLAIINEQVTEENFYIDNPEGYVHKYTDASGVVRLKAIRAALTVWVEEIQWAEDYLSLEEAAAKIPEDFGGFEGIYRFFFKENTTLKEDVTLPSQVREVYFETDEFGIEEDGEYIYIGRFQKILDLNGKTLTSPARLKLQSGLRITSNAMENGKTIPGKIKITSDDYVALHVEEFETLVDDRGWDVEERLPVLSNVEVNLGNHRAEFYSNPWTENDEILWHDLKNTVLQAEDIHLSGSYKFDKVTANHLENDDIFQVNTLDMCGGTLINRHRLLAGQIVNVGDFRNENDASVICNELKQQEGKNTYFGYDSRILFNNVAVLYNVYAENAIVGKGSGAEIQMNGDFSVGEQDQKLWIVITDSYADLGNLRTGMTYFDPHSYHDDRDVVLKVPDADEKLFTTDNSQFPAGDIAVLPNEIYDVSGNHVGYNGITGAILRVEDGKNVVRAAGETVSVFAVNADGETESWLKGFTGLDEAVTYLKEIASRNVKYVLHISQYEIDFGGKFEMPTNAAQITIRGGMDVPVVLKNTGDIKLATDFVFESINFEEEITIDANGKRLEFRDVRNPMLNDQGKEDGAECTKINAIKNADSLLLRYSLIELTDKNAAVSVKELEQVSSILRTGGNVSAETLLLRAQDGNVSHLEASGKVVLQDIVTYGMGNRINYDELEINGTLKAFTEDGRRDDSSVYAIPQSRTVTIGEGTEATVDYYVISEERPEQGEYLEVKKNALTLFFYDGRPVTTETQLAEAPNIAPTWFVYNRWGERMDDTQVEVIQNVTRKEGSDIKYGAKGDQDLNVILKACIEYIYEEETQTWGPVWGEVGKYVTLQEALTEIQNIDDCEMLYNITLGSDVKSAEFIFPSNAECIWIEGIGEMKNIHFKEELSVHSNVDFKNVNLVPDSENGTLNIDEYIVSIVDSKMKDNMTVVGNGNNCELHVASSEVTLKTLENVDILSAYLDAKVTVGDDFTTKVLCMIRNATICGLGTIQTEKIECYGENTLVTVPANVKWVDDKITAMTSNLDISGSLNTYETVYYEKEGEKIVPGALNIELGTLGEKGQITYIKAADFSQQLISSNKAVLAKAPNMGTEGLKFHGESGKIYKKSGNLVYKDAKAAVELVYNNGEYDENGIALEVTKVSCETFADAVAEINNLKTKRDYTIKFLTSEISTPTEFKMPNKNYVNTLIITAATENGGSDIYYVKDINLTSNTSFTMANLIQVSAVKENGTTVYKPVAGDKAVKIKTGGNNLTFEGGLYFNTPIAFEGGNKGTLSLGENARIHTVYNYKEVPEYAKDSDSYIQGTISKFANVSVEQRLYLDGWTANGKYTPAEISVTGLNVISVGESYNDITVGRDGSSGNKVKVNDLTLNGGNLYVYGDGEFKNVAFAKGVEENTEESAAELWVYGQKFNITGVLTSTVAFAPVTVGTKEVLGGAKLVTNVNSKLEPVLNVSGTVALGDIQKDRIIVRVMDPANDALTGNKAVPLGEKAGKKTYNSYLLKAKKANEAAFLADWDCTGKKKEFNYETSESGYFLKKNKDFVEVCYSDDIGVVLCKALEDGEKEFIVVNYYTTVNDAITAIKNLKDKTAEYKVVLLKNVGSESAPYKMTVPTQAERVFFTAAKPEYKLYNSSNVTQKMDMVFEDITVVNSGTWNAGKFDLEIANADFTVKGKTTVANLVLINDAILRTQNATVLTDILNYYSDGKDRAGNKIVFEKTGSLNIKGTVENVVGDQSSEEEIPKLILDAAGKVEPIAKTGHKYVLADAAKLAVLEKETMNTFEFYNGKEGNVDEWAVWTSKGIFLTADSYTNDVDVVKYSEDDGVEYTTRCLDMTEASNYINKVSEKYGTYQILLENDIKDTKVTDAEEISTLTLPGKDKSAGIYVLGRMGDKPVNLTFKKNLKATGLVVIENINLINDSFSISCDKNSDVKEGKETIPGMSQLTLDHVKAEGLKSIAGNKGATEVHIVRSELDLSGGVTNVVRFTFENSRVTTKAKSAVQTLTLHGASSWDAMGATTIGDVEVMRPAGTGTDGKEPASYVSTYHKKGKPQLTVTGSVNGEILPIVVYRSNDKDRIQVDNYKDTKLVLAKNESAEKFIAYPFVEYYEETFGAAGEDENLEIINGYRIRPTTEIVGYKDKDGYVYNGDRGEKQIILSQYKNQQWSDSYAASYEEAISMINQYGNKEAEYKITFIRGNDEKDENHILLENTLLLPKANKAKSLTINGDGRKMTYEGGISATCNLAFENITFHEVKRGEPVNGITLNCNKYKVSFGEGVSTVYDTGSLGESYQLVFTSIKAPKGSLALGNNMAYSFGEVNVGEMFVEGYANLFAPESNVTVSDLIYRMAGGELHIQSGKTMTFHSASVDSEEIQNAGLRITTQYTEAETLEDSQSQLTIKGEVDPRIWVNITPLVPVEGQGETGYQVPEGGQLQKLIVKSVEGPQPFQKVITAPKMASENVSLLDQGCRPIRHDGGIYFTYDNTMEVVGYEEVKEDVNEEINKDGNENMNEEGNETEDEGGQPESGYSVNEVFRASYLNWDMAIKEIDSLNRTDWIYDIILYHDLGSHNTPISFLSMPTKAKALAVCGTGDTGILTTSTNISLGCPTEFRNITLCAVEKIAEGYAPIPLTLDGGKFYMSLRDMQRGCDIDAMGWFKSKLELTGEDNIEIFCDNFDFFDVVSKISEAGTVTLHTTPWGWCHYEIPGGIQNVEQLIVMPGTDINTGDGEISVQDLSLGEASGMTDTDDWDNEYQIPNGLHSNIQAKNITVSGTMDMASANMKAGTKEPGDGKITLNHVVFKDTHNHIEGKQDKDGNSLITIQGTMTTEDINPGWSTVTIALCLSNSVKRYAQLSDGMTLLTAPNAITSLLRPHYNWGDEQNMGPEIIEWLPELDENGEPIIDYPPIVDENGEPIIDEVSGEPIPDEENGVPRGHEIYSYGLYQSGDEVKYGRLRDIVDNEVKERNEVILWFGTDDPDSVSGNAPTMEYATFEEALAVINRMPEYEEYTIELLKDVELGNKDGDSMYHALTLPAKISGLTIRGWGRSLTFAGDIALKSNTTFEGINLVPMKTEKGGSAPTMANITVGNYVLTVKDARVGYWDGEPYNSEFISCLDKISGSAKGRLIIGEYTGMDVNSISGVAVEFAGNGRGFAMDDRGTSETEDDIPVYSRLAVKDSMTTKELKFADYTAAYLQVYGKLTADAIYVVGKTEAVIGKYEGGNIQVKGTTRTLEDGSKVTDSVFFDEVLLYEEREDGEQVVTGVEKTETIIIELESTGNQDVPAGTKVITGKYLDPDDWTAYSYWFGGGNYRSLYQSGTDLYLGGVL